MRGDIYIWYVSLCVHTPWDTSGLTAITPLISSTTPSQFLLQTHRSVAHYTAISSHLTARKTDDELPLINLKQGFCVSQSMRLKSPNETYSHNYQPGDSHSGSFALTKASLLSPSPGFLSLEAALGNSLSSRPLQNSKGSHIQGRMNVPVQQ